jgi:hypothetical protein
MGDVRVNLNNPEMFYGITSRLVANNEYIVGSAIAMRPGYYPDKDKLFAPFAYHENKDGKGLGLGGISSGPFTQPVVNSTQMAVAINGINSFFILVEFKC